MAAPRHVAPLLIAALALCLLPARAQNDAQVKSLYAEAKTAQASCDLATAIQKYQELVHIGRRV
jgi:hypothetical protein